MAIEENPDIPVFLLGHSMGGFTVSLYGAKYPDKKLRGIITSGALTADNGNLIRGVPGEMDVHTRLANQLGSGVCSVQEVVDWYGKIHTINSPLQRGYAMRSATDLTGSKRKSRVPLSSPYDTRRERRSGKCTGYL